MVDGNDLSGLVVDECDCEGGIWILREELGFRSTFC